MVFISFGLRSMSMREQLGRHAWGKWKSFLRGTSGGVVTIAEYDATGRRFIVGILDSDWIVSYFILTTKIVATLQINILSFLRNLNWRVLRAFSHNSGRKCTLNQLNGWYDQQNMLGVADIRCFINLIPIFVEIKFFKKKIGRRLLRQNFARPWSKAQ